MRQVSWENLRMNVIGVAAEAQVAPAEIERLLGRLAQPAQLLQMAVVDVLMPQRPGELPRVEMRHVARARHGADIEQEADGEIFQELLELLDRPGGVAD